MCNNIDVTEPVLELVRIENSTFNKNLKDIKMSSCSFYLLTEQNNFPGSADLSDITTRNILQICIL